MLDRFPVLLAFAIGLIGKSYAQEAATLIVSPEYPVRHSDTALRKELLQWSMNTLGPNKIFNVQPSSAIFPGKVKPGFELINTTFHLIHKQSDTAQYNLYKKFIFAHPFKFTLYSTGLYAVAGQPVYIHFPPSLCRKKIYVVIGAHSDYLADTDSETDWRRMPLVASGVLLDSSFQFISSPFGGLIYIATEPNNSSIEADFHFKNVIKAPYYKLGSTTAVKWKQQLLTNKAPWGEIATDKVIITLPDSALQKIENPENLLTIWNKIVSTEAELAQMPAHFIRPLRMVIDEQISAGAMHSGYPVMIHHSPAAGMLTLDIIANPEKLLTPGGGGANWGFFHEIGHNLQNQEWVFDGTTEVSCNFFTLYVFDKLIKSRNGHENIQADFQEKLMQNYFRKGASYKSYQEDPFLGLIPFMQLQKKFGWTPFKKVFKWYLNYPSSELDTPYANDSLRQKINQLKINRFVERFSITTQANLAPFFRTWGIPIEESVDENLRKYKTWFPKELKRLITNRQ